MSSEPRSDSKSIIAEYELPHPPSKVWRALTEADLLAAWLMPNDIRAVVGHSFTFKTSPMPGWDGVIQCKILELEAPTRLRYSWTGGAESSRLESEVLWTLAPTASGGTHLRLEHSGFLPINAFAFDAMGKGWRGPVGQRMSDVLSRT